MVALTGTDDFGHFVTFTTMTNAEGYYIFSDLRPGTYQIVESPPTAFVHGPSNPGSNGGDAGVRTLANINLPVGVNSVSNNFAEERRKKSRPRRPGVLCGPIIRRAPACMMPTPHDSGPAIRDSRNSSTAGEVPKGVGDVPECSLRI